MRSSGDILSPFIYIHAYEREDDCGKWTYELSSHTASKSNKTIMHRVEPIISKTHSHIITAIASHRFLIYTDADHITDDVKLILETRTALMEF